MIRPVENQIVSDFKTRLRLSERGSVMILFAMLIFAILVIGALALDISQRAVSEREGNNYAKFAALAALQEYSIRPKRNPTETEAAIVEAYKRAESVGSLNLVLRGGGSGHANNFDSGDDKPKLVAGKFYSALPEGKPGCANPCAAGGSIPCFVPMENVNSACDETAAANAFRVHGRYFSNVRSILGQVLGQESYNVEVDEIAAFAPRHGMFLVDISSSMFSTTHGKATDHPAFYSYVLHADNPDDAIIDSYEKNWPTLEDSRSGDAEGPTKHFKSDYVLATPMPDSDYASTIHSKYHPNPADKEKFDFTSNKMRRNYRIDHYLSPNYTGAQPFTTVMSGLNKAVQTFKDRSVTGDKLGIVFFDQIVTWSRVFKPTSDFNYLQKFTQVSGDDLVKAKESLALFAKHGIFPGGGSYSNLRLAMEVAMEQLKTESSNAVSAVDFIAYFGDGLANCSTRASDVNLDVNGTCCNTWYCFRDSMNELREQVAGELYPKRIPLHVILAGANVGPHTLAWNDGASSAGCMSDESARKAEPPVPFVAGGGATSPEAEKAQFDVMSPIEPFYQVNEYMYKLARMTGGVWGPIRVRPSAAVCAARGNPPCTTGYSPAALPVRNEFNCGSGDDTDVIGGYIEDIMGSNPFMIVPKD